MSEIKSVLLLLFVSSFAFACSESSGTNSTSNSNEASSGALDIKIKVEGLKEGTCFLNGIYGDQLYTLDSLKSDNNGRIHIQMDTAVKGGLYYVILPDRRTFVQMLLAEDQEFEMESTLASVKEDMKIKGSIDNELFYENLAFEADHNKKFQGINLNSAAAGTPERKKLEDMRQELVDKRVAHIKEITARHPNSFFSKFKIAGQNPELKDFKLPNGEVDEKKQVYYYRNEFWDNVDFTDDRLVRTPVFHNKLERFLKKLTPQTGDSIVKYADFITRKSMANDELFKYTANYVAIEYDESNIMDWEKIFVHMVENFFTYELAFWSDSTNTYRLHQKARQMKPSLLGQIGQDIEARNEQGGVSRMYDIKSELLVLFIYTPECEHCQKEAPELVKIYNQWKQRGVDVFALCMDPGEDIWKKFIKDNNFPWKHNVYDPDNESRFRFKYNVDITPEIYVLDKDRKIVGKNLKAFQLPTIFERHL